jgi:3-hydroxymyristoyl/3-hydroxydecanoyl-(acyl carrier protein) dehydratase
MPRDYQLAIVARDPLHAHATFPPKFPGFDGHFPDAPILPGFMHVQLALDTLALANLPANLAGVQNAKFVRGVPPDTQIEIVLIRNEDATWDVRIADPLGDAYSHFLLRTEPVA